MHQVEQKALSTYQKNMLFFKEQHPEVFKKLSTLEEAMRIGRYKERFALEYLQKGYFDLRDTQTGEWLYGHSSIEHAEELAEEIDFRKDRGTIETFYNINFEGDVSSFEEADPAISPFVTSAPVIDYVTKNVDKKSTTMKKIYKFIFFGVGLGLHLETIHKKIQAPLYLIIEDNIEIFRFSLFVTDYSKLAKSSRLYFSVMEDTAAFKESFNAFFYESIIRNNFIKYSLFYSHYDKKIALVQNFIVSSTHLSYPHDRLLAKNRRVLHRIAQKASFLDLSKKHRDKIFTDRPIVVVAAGPSLKRNIDWLRQNADRVTIISAFMVSTLLESEGIAPDIVVHIDEQTEPVLRTLERMKDPKKFFDKSLFLLAPSVDLSLFFTFTDSNRCFFFEDRTRYRYESGYLEGFSVGEISYALALIFGAKEIALLGLDLALDPKSGQTHIGEHVYSQSTDGSSDGTDGIVSLRGSTFEVPGNLRKRCLTIPLFFMSIHRVDHFTRTLKGRDQRVYNLNDGAKFSEIEPVDPKTLSFEDRGVKLDGFSKKLLDFFVSNSSDRQTELELEAMHAREKDMKTKLAALERFTIAPASRIEVFEEEYARLCDEMIKKPVPSWAGELSQILVIYLANTGGYIGDFTNTKELKNPKRHIKRLQKIVAKQFQKLIEGYEKAFKKSMEG